ncbi:MAG: hypothetical protein JEZ09_08285 [Salinivirgaceae bacterium]|nr:hypothetical protein [Salinivirgaceae bacterium]
MKQFKNMTIGEFLEFLGDSIKENITIIEKNETIVKEISQNELAIIDVQSQKMELVRINEKITSEKQDIVALFNDIIDFYKKNEKKLMSTIENKNSNHIKNLNKYLGSNFSFESEFDEKKSKQENNTKSIDELNELLQEYIAEENYEECIEIQLLIEKQCLQENHPIKV